MYHLGKNALIHALENNNPEEAKNLIRHGADLNAKTTYDWNVLHFAARYNHLWLFQEEEFSSQLPNFDRIDGENTPLAIAAANGNAEIVQIILSKYYRNDQSSPNILPALNLAIDDDHSECVKSFIKFSPQLLNIIDPKTKNTILHKIAIKNAIKTFEMLNEYNEFLVTCLLDKENAKNLTPLHVAKQCNRWDLIFKMLGFSGMDSPRIETLEPSEYRVLDLHFLNDFRQFKEQHGADYREDTNVCVVSNNSGTVWKI